MRCKSAWWYSAALAAAGSLHLILYVRYVHTRIVRGVRRKLFVMYAVESILLSVKQVSENFDWEPSGSSKYIESFNVFGVILSGIPVGSIRVDGLVVDVLALPPEEVEQWKKVMQDAPVLHDFVDKQPLVVTSGYSSDKYKEEYDVQGMELSELPAVLVYYACSETQAGKALDRLVMYQVDKVRFWDSEEFQKRVNAHNYILRGEKYREEIREKVRDAEWDAAIAATKEYQAAREAAEEERIAQDILNFREEIEEMEAIRLQWSLDAPSEMEAAAAEAEAELDEQFARRLDFINEANSLTEVLADSSEPDSVQNVLGKLGFAWGYMSLVLCAFLGVIAYVVM